MDVYIHFQHKFMFKNLKVNFASDDPFNKIVLVVVLSLH